ncbi:hypothetical protein ALP39_200458 [Pseudomonas marginalis pv. marginalis]|nr:hypothetical protein ALP39_200458 [Pseudomonas marginalis pv. marginalis]
MPSQYSKVQALTLLYNLAPLVSFKIFAAIILMCSNRTLLMSRHKI